MIKYCVVEFNDKKLTLECEIDDGVVYALGIETTEEISAGEARQIFADHEPELAVLAQDKYDEARRGNQENAILHHELDELEMIGPFRELAQI